MLVKKPRGRPTTAPELRKKKRQVSLADSFIVIAKRIGGGNISEGIRIALAAMEKEQSK